MRRVTSTLALSTILATACGGGGSGSGGHGADAGSGGSSPSGTGGTAAASGGSGANGGSSASGGGSASGGAGGGAGGTGGTGGEPVGTSPVVGGCPIFPANNIFNTPIDGLPAHPNSTEFMTTIGKVKIHLDLGQSEDMKAADTYYGIPYNVVHGNSITWPNVAYTSKDTGDLGWDPTTEADCASGSAHALVSPCTADKAASPLLPIPSNPLVEGGVFPDVDGQDYGDHHILIVDQDTCRLWESYHSYTGTGGTWDIFGSASFDLKSNALRPKDWTSADAAGFPIMPLLLRADEASSGTIKHALRFTIDSGSIRTSYTWPARHLTSNGSASTKLPQMGQLFRIKSSYAIPANYSVQSKAILTALKTYGVYLADGGSNLYIQGEPNAKWADAIFDEVQSVTSDQFEAVDLSSIQARAGFDVNSGAVPP